MREILFRGKRTYNGEWVQGNLLTDGVGYGYAIKIIDKKDLHHGACFEVNSETICEFTGLYDKNGKRIFEGDIITANVGQSENEDEYLSSTNIVVSFENGYFYPFAIACGWRSWVTDIEVIGNKWDNPELLKED